MTDKRAALERWADAIIALCALKSIGITSIETIAGPRAGALEISAKLDAGPLRKALIADDCALLRQTIPWDFPGSPAAFMSGRYVRVEAGWEQGDEESDITLASLGVNPKGGGRWVVGQAEGGATVVASLNDITAHWLIAGQTGAGKTVAMMSAIVQLARDLSNQIILIDAKYGASLGRLDGMRGMVGPLARDADTAKLALTWAVAEMKRRYEAGGDHRRLIVFVDEIQELASDDYAVECLRKLCAQGRGANVHVVLGTQHPVNSAFGDNTIKRNVAGRLVGRVADAKSSEVAIGSTTPRADGLLGRGDFYVVTPLASHRLQVAYVSDAEIGALPRSKPDMAEWPGAEEIEASGSDFSPEEIGAAIVCAKAGGGRPQLQQLVAEKAGQRPGSGRADRLLAFGRRTLEHIGDFR